MEPDHKQKEQQEAEQRSSPSGTIIYKVVLKEGIDELERPSSALFWSGLAAGLSMGASLVAEGLLNAYLPPAQWRPLISKFGYSVGFLLVILGRQQLFTENTLTPILPLLRNRTLRQFGEVMRLWAVVLLANLLGSLGVAWVAGHTDAFAPEVQQEFSEIGLQAMKGSFSTLTMRGIFAD
jgi:formate/nitrite transporter FocA (FNT family)